jgi:replicative DNA helicase
MDTKLTLTIEQRLITQAKKYAKNKGRSLSDLVENYFKVLTTEKESEDIELSSTVRSLKGTFKLPQNIDYKKVLKEEISKKYL